MEAVGAAASILQLAAAATKTSLQVYEFISTIKNALREIESLSHDIMSSIHLWTTWQTHELLQRSETWWTRTNNSITQWEIYLSLWLNASSPAIKYKASWGCIFKSRSLQIRDSSKSPRVTMEPTAMDKNQKRRSGFVTGYGLLSGKRYLLWWRTWTEQGQCSLMPCQILHCMYTIPRTHSVLVPTSDSYQDTHAEKINCSYERTNHGN